MSLGWAQAEYKDSQVPWYKPTEQVVRCKYCGVRFKTEPKKKHLFLINLCVALASFVYLEQGFAGWGKWIIGIIFGAVLIIFIEEASRTYVRLE